jgi:peroxiredoxin (alkyl hydroperoxide reductase subunit C)
LADFRDRKAVLLVFYPLTFTGTCHGELTEIRDNIGLYANDDVQVLAVSVDSSYSHKIWALEQGYEFPLLADFWPHGGVAREYDVFNETAGFANRGTFLIDRHGVIRFAEMLGPGDTRDQTAWHKAIAALKD